MGEGDHLYRRGAGIMLLNRDGKVFVAARNDNFEDAWQMPQGGLDEGEEPWAGILRELEEETGIAPRLVEKIAEHPGLLRYELPEEWRGRLWGGKWIGQVQHWFLGRFIGSDRDIDLATERPEFRDWKWVEPEEVPELIVFFKRDLYGRLLAGFADYL
ncbi:MAG TPA: RNA pyrophosphohydrolase [Sphingomicrobium sp.]|nr:RNA pyrophosphohydrolase [Sphingomicrobium sp.]